MHTLDKELGQLSSLTQFAQDMSTAYWTVLDPALHPVSTIMMPVLYASQVRVAIWLQIPCMLRFIMQILIGCHSGDIRLAGGINSFEGRVEMCVNGEYSTVCEQMWDVADASVVCRQLGYSDEG